MLLPDPPKAKPENLPLIQPVEALNYPVTQQQKQLASEPVAAQEKQREVTLRSKRIRLLASPKLVALAAFGGAYVLAVVLLQTGWVDPFYYEVISLPTFADVNVPAPLEGERFKYAGSTASAALLCQAESTGDGGIHAQIRRVHPKFQLAYVEPGDGSAPNSGEGINMQGYFILNKPFSMSRLKPARR